MIDEKPIVEDELDGHIPDPDEVPLRDRKVVTQPYDLAVESLVQQIKNNTVFLRPMSNRPNFQRNYVWTDELASRLIESILLNIPIPPCYLSQNEDFELDVIDGQQRLYSIYRFVENQFPITGLEVLKELNGKRFFELGTKNQRQIKTHTFRCVLVTNESHPDVKFNVFERLNTNTVPLNQQELRNCIYRGPLNELLIDCSGLAGWLQILGKKVPDRRMREEELILRFFAFYIEGVETYRTPQKYWLNSVAKAGMKFTESRIEELRQAWMSTMENCNVWFSPKECFRRPNGKIVNRALFDLICRSASKITNAQALSIKSEFLAKFDHLLRDAEFVDLISRAVDHTSRTRRRFQLWDENFQGLL